MTRIAHNGPRGGRASSPRPRTVPTDAFVATGESSDLPDWVACSLDPEPIDEPRVDHRPGSEFRAVERRSTLGAWRSVTVPDGGRLDDEAFAEAVARAYEILLEDVPATSLLRAWNFIPGIGRPASTPSRDRYMVFNAGRCEGFARTYGRVDWFPVASGVGHAGEDLVLHLLHGEAEVEPVDNPRQVPPESYSRRFGHPAPAFARAARVRWSSVEALLVSGTASVVGEDSHHRQSLPAQLDETLRNLEVVVDRGWPGATPGDLGDWLVYLPDRRGWSGLAAEIARRWPSTNLRPVARRQGLCRPELLVEIECAGFRDLDGERP